MWGGGMWGDVMVVVMVVVTSYWLLVTGVGVGLG